MPLDRCGRSSDDFDCDPTGGVGDVGPEAVGSPPPQPATAIPAACRHAGALPAAE
jgi:hypothetical protein